MYESKSFCVEGHEISKTIGRSVVLPPQSFLWETPQCVAVVGPNGSGKTTLLRIVGGLDTHDGELNVNSCPPASRKIRSVIAYCPPNPALFSDMTILTQCEYISSLYPWKGLDDAWWSLVDALCFSKQLLNRRPYAFSSGEIQKASLLVSFARPHAIALLDEPTRSLDKESTVNFMKWIQDHCRNRETLVVLSVHEDLFVNVADVVHSLSAP